MGAEAALRRRTAGGISKRVHKFLDDEEEQAQIVLECEEEREMMGKKNTNTVIRGSRAVTSERTRARGRGATQEERKRSRASFKGWDTRLENAANTKRTHA